MDEAKLEARLRRTAWIQLAIGIALIPLVYWLMVEVLLPRFWLEDEKHVPESTTDVVSQLDTAKWALTEQIAHGEPVHSELVHAEDAKAQ